LRSDTDYSDTTCDATDCRDTVYLEPMEIYIEYDNYQDMEYEWFDPPPWRIRQQNEQIETRKNWKKKPIKKPQHHPRPEINRRMMWCDRRD